MLEKTGRFKQGPTYNIRNNEANKKSVPVRYYNLNELNENETPLPKCINLCGINSICCTVSIVAIPHDLGCFFRNTSCLATYFRSQENSAFRIRDSLIAVTLHFRKVILWPVGEKWIVIEQFTCEKTYWTFTRQHYFFNVLFTEWLR